MPEGPFCQIGAHLYEAVYNFIMFGCTVKTKVFADDDISSTVF